MAPPFRDIFISDTQHIVSARPRPFIPHVLRSHSPYHVSTAQAPHSPLHFLCHPNQQQFGSLRLPISPSIPNGQPCPFQYPWAPNHWQPLSAKWPANEYGVWCAEDTRACNERGACAAVMPEHSPLAGLSTVGFNWQAYVGRVSNNFCFRFQPLYVAMCLTFLSSNYTRAAACGWQHATVCPPVLVLSPTAALHLQREGFRIPREASCGKVKGMYFLSRCWRMGGAS